MTLEDLGWGPERAADLATDQRPGRVLIEHQDRFTVARDDGERDLQLSGTLRAEAKKGDTRPVVGDWVAISEDDSITALLPRTTAFRRRAAGRRPRPQTVAANLDRVLVVTSCNREFNPRRLERYLAASCDSGAQPALVLNKVDLASDAALFVAQARALAPPGTEVAAISATTGEGLDSIEAMLAPGRTIALVGSSGVGKSTLVNQLLGEDRQETLPVREADDKGRHTTTRRELFLLPRRRGVLIDTPGMRELQLWIDASSLAQAFAEITELAARCRFRDCSHQVEPGCAVAGRVADERLSSFERLRREVESSERGAP